MENKHDLDSPLNPQASSEEPGSQTFNRRTLLQVIGGVVGAVVVAGCGGGSSTVSSTTGTTTTTTTHVVTPEGEIGPYFTDDSASGFNRSNVLSNLDGSSTQAGIPLTLNITVYDTENSNAPLAGAQVDIWHCNASGLYSNEAVENTLGQTWLRGYQITDANGLVTFKTLVPGWYQGRTTHIHLRVRSKYNETSSTSDGTNTTQLFFPQTLVDTIDTTVAPYSAEGKNTTTNANDHVYTPETKGQMELTLTGDNTNGYTTSVAINLPITSE